MNKEAVNDSIGDRDGFEGEGNAAHTRMMNDGKFAICLLDLYVSRSRLDA